MTLEPEKEYVTLIYDYEVDMHDDDDDDDDDGSWISAHCPDDKPGCEVMHWIRGPPTSPYGLYEWVNMKDGSIVALIGEEERKEMIKGRKRGRKGCRLRVKPNWHQVYFELKPLSKKNRNSLTRLRDLQLYESSLFGLPTWYQPWTGNLENASGNRQEPYYSTTCRRSGSISYQSIDGGWWMVAARLQVKDHLWHPHHYREGRCYYQPERFWSVWTSPLAALAKFAIPVVLRHLLAKGLKRMVTKKHD